MKAPLNVLHIEDSKEDSELIHQLLASNGMPCEMTRVETREQVFDALENQPIDLILADCKLPNFSGLRALEIAHALKPEVPFVFVSGTIGEETAIESLRNGATDYVLKDRLSRLAPAIRRALSEAEERTLCRELQQRLHEAGRLEAISTLSHGIAHDFNNILTIVLGHASLLTMEHTNPARVLEISGTISEAAKRGSEIVQQLLAFARKSDGHVVPTDLNRYISAHVQDLRRRVPSHIDLTFRPSEELPNILADVSQVDRILINLITNSVDAMPKSGEIILSTKKVPASAIPHLLPEISAQEYVCLTVEDTGKGIDSITREHVFEPFFTTKERGRGTGLGLPVVYGLMQAHHGYVDVKSELGSGTAISLFFPVAKAGGQPVPTVAHFSDPSLSGSETILVVEDEVDVSFFLETMLETHGYEVLTASNATEARAIFSDRRADIDLVFSDIGLPKEDGITLCEKLRKERADLPIVLASGYPTKEYKERINELRPEAFLSKPYFTEEILLTVRNVLDGGIKVHLVS
jgi:signal transduction histidine kinase